MNKKPYWIIFIICTVFSISIFNIQAHAGEQLKNREAVVKSLLIGINSENYGLRTSSAYMIGELNITEAVIPLLKMLKSEKNEEARIMAAVSLFKIGDARGIFAVKQAIRFDSSTRVSRMCEKIYNSFRQSESINEDILAGI
ncbi:MAG: hypothetical protein R6W68_15900 [Ignavibacteriaceae bacterium]